VILLDAYALVALLADEPAAGEVEKLLRAGDCAVNVVNLAEAVDVSLRIHRVPFEDMREVIDPLVLSRRLRLVAPDEESAWRAAALRRAYYARRTCEISLADCFLLSAAGAGDEIATADPAVAEAARAEDLRLLALPDSSGKRP
jgi:predicted nucleic acid-binding protein